MSLRLAVLARRAAHSCRTGCGRGDVVSLRKSSPQRTSRRLFSQEASPEPKSDNESSGWETFRDVAGFLLLSVGSGGCKFNNVRQRPRLTDRRLRLNMGYNGFRNAAKEEKEFRRRILRSTSHGSTKCISRKAWLLARGEPRDTVQRSGISRHLTCIDSVHIGRRHTESKGCS